MPSHIEDYALMGDCHTAALVGRDGSIDWLCFPRFDSGACFAALLGKPEHGRWLLRPAGEIRSVRRRYRDETLILETEYETDAGAVKIIDWMPVRAATEALDVMRIVEGQRGQVPMQLELVIRFDYGSIVPWVQAHDWGIRATAGPDSLSVVTDVDLHGEDLRTVAEFTVSAGQRIPFSLTWYHTYGSQPASPDPEENLRKTEDWWHEWSSHCTFLGWRRPTGRRVKVGRLEGWKVWC